MKRAFLKNILFIGALASIPFIFSSCGDDEPGTTTPAPEAIFSVAVDGKTVTITNSSTDATSYAWAFGDAASSTSTDEAPVFTYTSNGSYVITLTATSSVGSDVANEAVEIANITIDGNVADWADVPVLGFDGDGTFKEVKVENLNGEKLYFYILANSDNTTFLDLYLNLDYEGTITQATDTTGLNTGVYPLSNLGFDVLFEGFFGNTTARSDLSGMFYGVFHPDDADGNFSNNLDFSTRDEPTLSDLHITFSDKVAVGSDVAYEFSIDLSFFPSNLRPTNGDQIQFFIDEWNNADTGTEGWWGGFSGHYPTGQATETGEAAVYLLK